MRTVGIVLVIIGALALGYGGFTYVSGENVVDSGPVDVTAEKPKKASVGPLAGGIALVTGLILLASATRNER